MELVLGSIEFLFAILAKPKTKTMRKITLSIVALLSVVSLRAQWLQTNGPLGGNIWSLCNSNNYLYAGFPDGKVYKSTDNGGNWYNSNIGYTGDADLVTKIITKGDYVFASINKQGIFRESHNNDVWVPVNQGLATTYFSDLAVVGNSLFAKSNTALYRSDDDGGHWTLKNSAASGNLYNSMESIHGYVLIASDYGVYRSSDHGETWSNMGAPIPDHLIMKFIRVEDDLFAGVLDSNMCKVFKSTDDGDSWTHATGLDIEQGFLDAITSKDDSLFAAFSSAGIYFSTNGGLNWEEYNNPFDSRSTSCLVTKDNHLFAGSFNGGINRAQYGNGLWSAANTGILKLSGLRMVNANNHVFSGLFMHNLWVSSDAGVQWNNVSDTAATNGNLINKFVTNGTDVYACTIRGICHTPDYGATWNLIEIPNQNNNIRDLLFYGDTLLVRNIQGIYKSTDHGTSWSPAHAGLPGNATGIAKGGSRLFVGSVSGLYMSDNGGTSWSYVNVPGDPMVSVLAVCDGKVFLSKPSGVYVSEDNGNTWDLRNNGIDPAHTPWHFVAKGSKVFMQAIYADQEMETQGRIYLSDDYGQNWIAIDTNFPDALNNFTMDDQYLYASVSNNSVWKTPLASLYVDNHEEKNFMYVAPNPFNYSTTFYFNEKQNGTKLQVLDITGKIINSQLFSGNTFTFEKGSLQPGIYTFRFVHINGKMVAKKVILVD